jgi:hypothetical protein
MVVNGAMDIRRKTDTNTPVLYIKLPAFFANGTGQDFSYIYDVRTTFDTFSDRFIVLGLQDNSTMDEKLLVIAVSKTSDPEQGWNFLTANVLRVLGDGRRCFPDSPDIGFDSDFFTFTANIFCVPEGTSLADSDNSLSDQFLYAFPKNSILGVFNSNVIGAQENASYYSISFERNYQTVVVGRLQPSSGAPTTLVIGVENSNFLLFKFDNLTSTEKSQSAALQSISLNGFVYDEPFYTSTSKQPSVYDLEGSSTTRPFTMRFREGSLYFATDIGVNVSSSNTPQNSGIRWSVVNVVNLTLDGTANAFGIRRLTGAYLVTTSLLDTSSLGEDLDAFYPAMSVDSNGKVGKLFWHIGRYPCHAIKVPFNFLIEVMPPLNAGISFTASSKGLFPGAYFACFEASNTTTYTIVDVKRGESAVVCGVRGGGSRPTG